LKPHGSLNWSLRKQDKKLLCLDDDAYTQREARGNIIPPTWDKAILQEWPWKPIWKAASLTLQRTRCLFVIGYSVPATDLTSQALIRSSLTGGDLRLLVVANPDPAARARVINLARGAIKANTRIVELNGLAEFAQLLDETPAELKERQAVESEIATLRQRVQTTESGLEDELNALEERIESLENNLA
jgi:hypothetical protein